MGIGKELRREDRRKTKYLDDRPNTRMAESPRPIHSPADSSPRSSSDGAAEGREAASKTSKAETSEVSLEAESLFALRSSAKPRFGRREPPEEMSLGD
jgi:hypothetical protein